MIDLIKGNSLACLWVCLVSPFVFGETHEPRIWKHRNGTSAAGKFIELNGDQVSIRYGDQTVKVLIKDLSIDDQIYLHKLTEPPVQREKDLKQDAADRANPNGVDSKDRALQEKPREMAEFIEILNAFTLKYGRAANDLQKSAVRTERAKELAIKMQDRRFQGWVGEIYRMTTNSNRDAIVSILIGKPNIRLENVAHPVKHGSELYLLLASCNKGDVVWFDGDFVFSKEDFLKENSLTENGSMMEPEFEIRFTRISKAAK